MSTVIAIISLSVDSERADAGRDGRTYLARPYPQAQTKTREYNGKIYISLDSWRPRVANQFLVGLVNQSAALLATDRNDHD